MGFTTAHLVKPIQIGRSYCIYYYIYVYITCHAYINRHNRCSQSCSLRGLIVSQLNSLYRAFAALHMQRRAGTVHDITRLLNHVRWREPVGYCGMPRQTMKMKRVLSLTLIVKQHLDGHLLCSSWGANVRNHLPPFRLVAPILEPNFHLGFREF